MRKNITAEEKEDGKLVGPELDLQTEVNKTSDAIRAAIENGDIFPRIWTVNKKIEAKPYQMQYLQLVPTSKAGCEALMPTETTWSVDPKTGEGDFDGPCYCKDFHYGYDLGVKSKMAQRLSVLVEGPDKAKSAAAKQLAKAFGITEEEAAKKIAEMGL